MTDHANLLSDLRHLLGVSHVLTGDDCAKWRHDWTGGYTADPIAVLRPADTTEVAGIVKRAASAGVPIVPVSGNTGVTGGTSGSGMLMLSVDRLNQIDPIDPVGRTVTVGAGVILSALHDAADAHDLIFPLTFGARGSAMIGGALATNAGGSNVLRYGNTRDLVLGIEVVLASGEVMNLMGRLHKDNAGLNLKHLIIGSEGTLGIITRAVVRLFPKPRATATAMVAPPSLPDALDLLNQLQTVTGGAVQAFEYMPRNYVERHIQLITGAREPFSAPHPINILVEVGAVRPSDATAAADGSIPIQTQLESTLMTMLEVGRINDAVVAQNEAQRAEMWARREAAAEITYAVTPFVDCDVAVALPDVDRFLNRAAKRLHALDPGATDFVVSHLGDGNIHYAAHPSRDDPTLKSAIRDMVDDVVQELSGSFSAEHGIGLSKRSSMAQRKDPAALHSMQAIKSALDPLNILNPGKVFPT